jgi:hypothetical protein
MAASLPYLARGFDTVKPVLSPADRGILVLKLVEPLASDEEYDRFVDTVNGLGLTRVDARAATDNLMAAIFGPGPKLPAPRGPFMAFRHTSGTDEAESAIRLHASYAIERAWIWHESTCVDTRRKAIDGTVSWRSGPPNRVERVSFALEGDPDRQGSFGDDNDLGIHLELSEALTDDREQVCKTFHDFWASTYTDRVLSSEERTIQQMETEETNAYRNTGVEFDREHRRVGFWMDRFHSPSDHDVVRHLMWIAECLHQVLPIERAAFGGVSVAAKFAQYPR